MRKITLFLILIIGATLRLYKWNGYSFWYDETNWLMISREDLLTSLRDTVALLKPPLFRLLIYIWSYISYDEYRLRLLPFAFGILSIYMTYKIAEKFFNSKIGFLAAFLISMSPFHIYYSQELTHYTLITFLVLCSMYYLMRSLEKDTFYSWLGFVSSTSLCIYTSYLSFFVIVAQNLFFFISYRKNNYLVKKWLLAQFIILLLYLPWVFMIPLQFRFISVKPAYIYWMPSGSLLHIFQILRLFNVGYNANFFTHFLAIVVFFSLFLIGIFSNLKKDTRKLKLLIIWLFIPMLLSILFSWIAPTFTYRNFIFCLPAYYIIIALGVNKFKKYMYIPISVFVGIFLLSLNNYYADTLPYPENFYRPGVHAKKDNRGATKYIFDNFQEGDIALHTCISTFQPYIYYLYILNNKHSNGPKSFIYELYNISADEGDIFYPCADKFVVGSEKDIPEFIKPETKRIWLVFSFWEPHVLNLYPHMKENKIKKWMDVNFPILDHKKFKGIDVLLYQISK